jgi:hypothetical protein
MSLDTFNGLIMVEGVKVGATADETTGSFCER